MRALIGATLCTFLFLGGCSKSDDETKTSESLLDKAESTVNAAAEKAGDITSEVVDATQQGGEAAAGMAIDEASDIAAVEAEKASDNAVEAATDSASKVVEDASGMLDK